MTKFNKDDFNYHGGFLTYGTEHKFVARFKYNKRDRVGFVNFLVKNFSVEEYFTALEVNHAPSQVLRTKGYVGATAKKVLANAGYPQTVDGLNQYLASA
jgi:hypothetical protein